MLLTGIVRPDQPLIVVALSEEAAYLRTRYPMLITGVGKVQATLAVSRLLGGGVLPAGIINLGTAGALRPGLSGTYEVGRVLQHDLDAAVIRALTGRSFGEPLTLAGSGRVLASGDAFVSDSEVRARLAEQADLVDMEGYAVAAAAAAYGVGVRMVKHVSDDADSGAIASWAETVDGCAQALAVWLEAEHG
jgi:adenosylhomocysteine nucleosidase